MKKVYTFLLILWFAVSPFAFSRTAGEMIPPQGLEDEIRFWRTVFGTYGDSHVLFYDEKFLNVIYEVLDFSGLNARRNLPPAVKRDIRQKEIRWTLRRIGASLRRLARGVPDETLTDEERYYQYLFNRLQDRDALRNAAERIRVQTGQKDRLQKALAKASPWRGDIELIFEQQGIPKELTALMFVESMFNPKALSNAGASGLWQFMPETGRSYVAINSFWDDRNDIPNASAGAARFLKDLYHKTGNWPLAINAYHSGPARILKAVNTLGTNDIAVVVHQFEDLGYGFYSRNYVPQFFAMVSLFQNEEAYFGPSSEGGEGDREYDIVQTADFVILPKIAGRFGIGINDLRSLNTALKEEVLAGKLPLPPHYPLRVPKGTGYYFAVTIGSLGRK